MQHSRKEVRIEGVVAKVSFRHSQHSVLAFSSVLIVPNDSWRSTRGCIDRNLASLQAAYNCNLVFMSGIFLPEPAPSLRHRPGHGWDHVLVDEPTVLSCRKHTTCQCGGVSPSESEGRRTFTGLWRSTKNLFHTSCLRRRQAIQCV